MPIGRRRLLIVAAALAGIILSGCGEKAGLELRTDPEPLTHRLNLPQRVGPVRWVSVSPVHDTGWVPPKVQFYDVYAYIELDEEAWNALEKSSAAPGVRDDIVIPEPVAAIVIPPAALGDFHPSSAGRRGEGPSFDTKSLSAEARTEVQKAIRVGGALVVEMRVR